MKKAIFVLFAFALSACYTVRPKEFVYEDPMNRPKLQQTQDNEYCFVFSKTNPYYAQEQVYYDCLENRGYQIVEKKD